MKHTQKGNSDVIAIYWFPHYIKEGESISLKKQHFNIPCVGENLAWI